MRGACLVLFLATARGSPIDYDHEPPDPRVSRVAAVVRAANHRALERLRRVLAPRAGGGGGGALGALCAPPFPPHAREAVRWFHVPRCGTTFFNALVRYVCPSSAVAWRATVGEAALEPAHLMAATCGAATGSDAPPPSRRAAAATPCCEPFYGVRDPTPRACLLYTSPSPRD